MRLREGTGDDVRRPPQLAASVILALTSKPMAKAMIASGKKPPETASVSSVVSSRRPCSAISVLAGLRLPGATP
jgi:hypothetical protein